MKAVEAKQIDESLGVSTLFELPNCLQRRCYPDASQSRLWPALSVFCCTGKPTSSRTCTRAISRKPCKRLPLHQMLRTYKPPPSSQQTCLHQSVTTSAVEQDRNQAKFSSCIAPPCKLESAKPHDCGWLAAPSH
ncbi:hypothetical protein V8C44DRAFT_347483 [Trichoderma aethiopicum]